MKKFLIVAAVLLGSSIYANTGVTLYRMKNALLVQEASKGNEEIVLVLLQIPSINPSAQDGSGRTALHYASERGLLALAQALMLRGTNSTIKDDAGETALSLARKAGQHEMEVLFGT